MLSASLARLFARTLGRVPSPSDSDTRRLFEQHSSQQLTSLLRTASNRLEMLLSPAQIHHDDDAERQRIFAMNAEERTAMRREAMKTINDVRAELRRRAAE
jgi:hypothetical protein